jgi:1-deoxy-D-xylulose-5-phosphate synthase
MLNRVPAIGERMTTIVQRFKDSFKYLLMGGILFEQMGLTYIGPVDGHDYEQLLSAFEQARSFNEPVLVHVVTVKGKGYEYAEQDSFKWHGISKYKIENGQVLKAVDAPPMYTQVFGDTLIELAEQDERIIAITPAMPGGSGLVEFSKRFPGRMIDVGIAEQHAATFSSALALSGMKPVFAVYSTFLQRAYDQVLHDICRMNLNVVFAIDRAGFVGADGETHHGLFDMAFLRSMPNMVIMMPKDENEMRNMMKTALDYDEGPIALRYPRIPSVGVQIDAQMSVLPIGKWEVVQEGKHVCLLAVGPMVHIAYTAAERLKRQGISCQVVNMRFIKPMDEEMLAEISRQFTNIIVIEEGIEMGGLGSSVLEFYARHNIYDLHIKLLAVPDVFVEHGTIEEEREATGLTAEHICVEAMRLHLAQRMQIVVHNTEA